MKRVLGLDIKQSKSSVAQLVARSAVKQLLIRVLQPEGFWFDPRRRRISSFACVGFIFYMLREEMNGHGVLNLLCSGFFALTAVYVCRLSFRESRRDFGVASECEGLVLPTFGDLADADLEEFGGGLRSCLLVFTHPTTSTGTVTCNKLYPSWTHVPSMPQCSECKTCSSPVPHEMV
jgi:hypothetical protein